MPYVMLAHYRRLVWLACRGVGIYMIVAGLFTLWGGDLRMEGPAYTALRALAAAAMVSPSWWTGVWAILAGALTLVPRYRVSQGGLALVVLWHLYVALSFALSVYDVPRAGVLGITSTAFVGIIVAGLIAVRHADRGARHL